MDGALMRVRDLSAADLDAWRDLASRAAEPNPFLEPEVLMPAVRLLGDSRVRLCVARTRDGWTAAAPFRIRPTWRLLPIPSMALWQHDYAFLGTPLVDRDDPRSATTALVDTVLSTRGVGVVTFDSVAQDGPVARGLAERLTSHDAEPLLSRAHQRAFLQRRVEPTYLEEVRSPHHRREDRRLARSLARTAGGPLTVDDRAGDPDAVESFLRLEAAGWKGRAGTAFLCRRGHAAFFRELCADLASQGRLQLLMARAGPHLVAMKVNIHAGDGLFCFKIAYSEVLGRYSPGVLLEIETIRRFHADPALMFMDSCAAPTNDMINRLWPDRRTIMTGAVPTLGALGRAARHQAPIALRLERRVRHRKAT